MSKIEIFEAAGCCATSSVVVSDEAVKWNASAGWPSSRVAGRDSIPDVFRKALMTGVFRNCCGFFARL